jgi:outer membrane translocation and assembly module TamA
VTDYLGKQSITGQVEARWQASPRWGFVAFGGAGSITKSFSAQGESEQVPSYGVGVRFMVLKNKRVNMRLDYAKSDESDAWYVSVGEAF